MATFTWVGGTSSDWTDATNWSPQGIPNDGTAVAIVNNPANDANIINGGAITVGSLSVGGTGISAGQVIVGGSPEIGLGGGGSLIASQSIVLTSTDENGALIGGPNGVVTTPSMTVAPGVAIGGGGTYDVTNLVNNGLILADGGRPGLELGPVVVQGSTISGTGNLEIHNSSMLEINAATSQSVAVVEDPGDVASLVLDSPGTFKGAVNLAGPDSRLNLFLRGQVPTGVNYDFQSGSLIITGAGGTQLEAIPLSSPNAITFSVTASALAGYGEISIGNALAQPNLPPPDANGVIHTTLSSTDLAQVLQGNQSSLKFVAGTESVALVDGTLSVGSDTNEAFIARLYQGLFGRAYDANGLSGWDSMISAMGKTAVAQAFIDSPEYQAAHPGQDNGTFINSLYQSMLGRAADPAGLNGWTQALANGESRGAMAAAFADSPEAKNDWSGVTSAGVFAHDPDAAIVREDYLAAFGREAEAGGLSGWTNLLKNGLTPSALALGLAGSPEFQSLHGQQTDTQYVDSLYVNGLGRQAEPAGEAGWVNILQSGASRGDVLAAIAQSPEGQQHLQWALS